MQVSCDLRQTTAGKLPFEPKTVMPMLEKVSNITYLRSFRTRMSLNKELLTLLDAFLMICALDKEYLTFFLIFAVTLCKKDQEKIVLRLWKVYFCN